MSTAGISIGSKRPVSSRPSPEEDEEDMEGLSSDLKKLHLDTDNQEFTVPNIMAAIVHVTNWKHLGRRLGLKQSTIDKIAGNSECSIHDLKFKLISKWIKDDKNATWEKLLKARDPEFTLDEVLNSVLDVTNWKDLGLQLGQKAAQLSSYEGEDPKGQMIDQWMKTDPEAGWDKLQIALESPAMCEIRVSRGISKRRGSSFDGRSLAQSSAATDKKVPNVLECNERNVRNVIANVTNLRELGERLKIPSQLLDEMEKNKPEHQKLKLVEAWFRVDESCTWETLQDAMKESKTGGPGSEFTLTNVMSFIAAVTNWKDLGLQLGLTTAQLNCFDEKEEGKLKMIEQWMKIDTEASWEKLQAALRSPAMCENKAALSILLGRSSSYRSSFDRSGSLPEGQSSTASDIHLLEFDEKNVRNAIINVKSVRDLGERLKIPTQFLDDIEKHSPENQKLKLVEAWFKVDVNCNWNTLETALRATRMTEWASTRKSMSGSFSEETFSMKNGSSIDLNIEPLPLDDDVLFAAPTTKRNFAMIKKEFAKLMSRITKNLQASNPDMDEIHQYITTLFEAKIPREDNIRSLFTTLSENKCWNYFELSNLESIVEMFSGDQEEKNMEIINAYKKQLTGYKTATRIVDYIKERESSVADLKDEEEDSEEYLSILEEKEKYNSRYRSKLSVKLVKGDRRDRINISLESLLYVEKLWNSICLEFHMPSLPKLLDSIVAGSILIHWLISHVLVLKILEQIGDTTEFLEQECIASLSLEDVCIYDQEKGGVVDQKILQYVMLLLVTQESKEDKIEKFLQKYFSDINVTISEDGQTILLFAAQHGHKVMMEPLLSHGADLYCTDRNGTSILSISKPHQDLHEWIQDKCEDALITAAGLKPDLAIVRKSLEIGVNPNAKEKDEYGWTALMWASEKGHTDIVFYLVDQKANVNAQDFAHWTSLILSSRRGYLSIVRKLLDGGADVNKQTESLWSALMWTAQLGHTDVARLLLERGADAHTRDEAGFTPFLQASQDGNTDIVKLLVEHEKEFDINQVTNTGWSAAMLATKNGHESLLEYLIEKKCDIHYQREEDEITALHIASFKDNNNIVRRLCIHEKLEVDIQDCDGVTPLMYAAKKGLVQVTRTLVENGHAEVNIAENDNKWTALFFAMEGRHNDLLDYLLRATKVDLNHRDKWGHTIVDIAKSMNPDALKLFSKYYKSETDAILSKPAAPVNLKNYQQMLERLSFKVSATPKASIMAGAA